MSDDNNENFYTIKQLKGEDILMMYHIAHLTGDMTSIHQLVIIGMSIILIFLGVTMRNTKFMINVKSIRSLKI